MIIPRSNAMACVSRREYSKDKEDQRDEHDVEHAQPADALEYEEEVVEEFSHGKKCWDQSSAIRAG
jgi:hypothetical protein